MFTPWGLVGLALVGACRGRANEAPPVLAGPYQGQTADGMAVSIAFEGDPRSFRGTGAIGDDPLVVAGVSGWCGTGTLVRAGGGQALVELAMSSDGERLTMTPRGGSPLQLSTGGSPPPSTAGPFSGRYSARIGGAIAAEATLVQSGDLLAGVGRIGAASVGISGRVAGTRATGQATWLDGSQVAFSADLAPDQSLTLKGFGPPLTMAHGSSP